MIEYDQLYQEVQNTLSEYRFRHTIGVMKRALEYASIYHVDENIVQCCAIAHDIAKELTVEEQQYYIQKYAIQLDEIEKQNNNLMHAKIGAYICRDQYQFTDDMVNAILYHTTGREHMSILEKIIYLADATEENRTYHWEPYVHLIKEDIDLGMAAVAKWVIDDLYQKNKKVHPNSIKCYHYYVDKIDVNQLEKFQIVVGGR